MSVLDDLAFRLSRQLAGHPLFSRYFNSLDDFRSFAGAGSIEFENLFGLPLDELSGRFEVIGEQLFQNYNPPFIDVSEVLDFIEDELILSTHLDILNISCEDVKSRHRVISNAIAKSYFQRTLDEMARMADHANEPEHSPLRVHFDWICKVVLFLKGHSEEKPHADHLTCDFAHWVDSLQCELFLFSSGSEGIDRHARISLSHRRIHEQFDYVHSFMNAGQYRLAYSHLAKLYHTVLQLDQQIRSLQLLYKENEEAFFYDFINHKSSEEEGTYYFVSIRVKQIIDAETFPSRVKLEDFDALRIALLDIFKDAGLDSVVLLYEGQIRAFFKTKGSEVDLDIPDFMEKKVHRYIEKYALDRNYRIKSSGIGLDLVSRYPRQKIAILRQLNSFRLKEAFTFVTEQEIDELYDLTVEAKRITQLSNEALNEDRLTVFYQPIFGKDSQCDQYVEALVRAPVEDGFIEAGKFIHYLEQQGRMTDLDLSVLRHIRQDIPILRDCICKLSVNIYPSSFNEQSVVQAMIELADELRSNGIQLIIEITEQLFMQDLDYIEKLVHEHGIVFAMDDFGSGYSNLLQLIEYSEKGLVKVLKVDGSIVKKIEHDETVFKILQIIIQIASTLELAPVVMEYVFNEKVHEKLSALSVPLCYQGFYLAKPLPVDSLISLDFKV